MSKIHSKNNSDQDKPKLDRIDRRLLNLLQDNNLLTNQELADKVGLSPPPCLRRVRKLRDLGIIQKDVSLVDPVKVGHKMVVFTNVTLEKQREDLLESFERKMLKHGEILQCYFISGDADYLLVVSVADMEHYNDFAREVFANEPNIKMFRSNFCLNQVKYDTKIQLPES